MASTRHTKRRPLSEEEIVQAKDGVVEHLQQIAVLEGEFAVKKKEYAGKIKPHKEIVKDLMSKISSGFDEGSEWCRVVVDPITQTVKFFCEKRTFDADTQRYEYKEMLFDELTFEQVGEQQLTIWQQKAFEDDGYDTVQSIPNEVYESVNNWLEEFYQDREEDAPDTTEVLAKLARVFPEPVAEWYLKEIGEPSSNFTITFASQGLESALEVLMLDLESGDGDAQQRARTLSSLLYDAVEFENGEEILPTLIEWKKNYVASEEESDVEAEANETL